MATIQSQIQLYDAFSGPMMSVINAVNMGVSAMAQMQDAVNAPVDFSVGDEITDQMNQAMQAIEEARAKLTEPIQNPSFLVRWDSSTLPTFTSTGIERFEQEVQSTNAMLDKLRSTQANIANLANRTNIFPANMVSDMNTMQARIQGIQERIQAIENNPLNMGTDQVNNELEQLRGQLDQAVQEQNQLNNALDHMDVEAANEAYLRLSQTVGGTERYIRDNVDEQGRFNQEIEQGQEEANQLMNLIKGAVAAYATMQTVTNAMDLSDQLTSTTARLNLMNDGLQTTQDLQNMIFLSAQRARGAYQQTADAVSKLGLMAGDAFSSSEEIIAFTEQLNKQFTIAGTEAAGIDAAMLQLTQAMGSGVLRGEEYNSILEQAPNIIQAIADYMDVPKGQLKDMAAEGEITAEIVKNAMFAAADETNAKFEAMPKTFSQIWTSFQNTALMAFQPVLQRMNEIANSEAFQTFVNNAVEGLAIVAGVAMEIFNLLVSAGSMVADNWSVIAPILGGVTAALIAYYTALGIYNGIQLISNGIKAAAAFMESVHAASMAMETSATFAVTAAQLGFNAALYACPITWIIVLIIALVALLYAAVAAVNKFAGTSVSATGIIAGVFAVLGAHIINNFVVPIWNQFAAVANFFGNVFNDPVAAVKVLFYDMCLTVIGYIANLAHAIENLLNKIPGVTVDITSGLDNFYNGLEEAQQAVKDESGWVEYVKKMDFIDYSDAASAGYNFGAGIEESISNFDPASLFNTNVPGADDYANLADYGSGLDLSGIGSGVDDIAGNTGAIADNMDITEEDLKYLRDIAEQEAVNRFTIAEVNIDQSGMQNHISSGMDLDGLITGLTDSVNEAVDIITEGVHE